jgi:hypothetical protein
MRAPARATVPSRLRWAGALASAAALGALIAIGPPGAARAAGGPGRDQITGVGVTDSAVTVPWTHGLLDASNQPIASANADRGSASPTSPYSFMYSDFKNLSVTVSQTKDITHQGITVSWKGGQPTTGIASPQGQFLQLMECYGDSSSGPSPQDCEYGIGVPPSGVPALVEGRIGYLCAPGAVPSVTNPPSAFVGSGPLTGCDPQEPLAGASPPDVAPCGPGPSGNACNPGFFTIPFVPVGLPGSPVYSQDETALRQYFSELNSNEVPVAVTSPAGIGQLQFEALTGTEAPGLGCGEKETNGQPRGCWLVIVPRGQYEPNGYKILPNNNITAIQSSPLSASNWAMRIQVHLGYSPVEAFCPIGTQERATIGTQVITRAMQSWQLALNAAAHCSRVYGYSAGLETTSTQQLSAPGSQVGLAFTTIPIGSEAARGGGHPPSGLPPILYAPVAVSAVGFGFNINDGSGFVSTPVKLTPELLAKGLTQVYRYDLPDYYPYSAATPHPGPAWSLSNPDNISTDRQFETLNPGVPGLEPGRSLSPLLTEDHSALNQQVWHWIQADPAAVGWLDNGTKDAANSVTADPDYEKLKLGRAPAMDSFPRAYAACLDLGLSTGKVPKEEKKCTLDLLPYTDNYDKAASTTLAAFNPTEAAWDNNLAIGPDGTPGWWLKTGIEPIGQTFIWGISDTPDLAAYGLIDAQLCNDAGKACVAPSTASVTTALNSATKDRAGLLQVNPARPGNGGYPLVQVTYAAVPTSQSAAALGDYANLIAYAAGQGQTPGVAPGDLPPGYLPLPASLKNQAQAVVARLRAIAHPTPPPTRSHSPTPPSGSGSPTPSSPGSATPASTTPQPSSSQPGASPSQPSPTAGATASTPGLAISPPSAQLTGTATPGQGVGGIRWVLLAVVLAGAVSAALGAVLRYGRVPRWLQRMRP